MTDKNSYFDRGEQVSKYLQREGSSRRDFLKATAGAGVVAAGVGTGSAAPSDPTLSVSVDDVAVDGTTTASVHLSEVPDGLAGYDIDITVGDASVATITDATYPNSLGMTGSIDIADDGSSVNLRAADLGRRVEAGATDIKLGEVTIAGSSSGQTSVGVDITRLDADGGAEIAASIESATLTVGDGTSDPDCEPKPGGPTVDVNLASNTIEGDGTTEASVVLSKAPKGLAGFEIDVSVVNAAVASITDASYADAFGLSDDAQFADDGSSVRLKAADVGKNIQSGATNVELATVTLSSESGGETDVGVAVEAMDADGGSVISTTTGSDTLTVTNYPVLPGGPTVEVNLVTDTIDPDGTTSASIRLSNAPNGLSGFDLDVTVDDSSVATLSDASYADAFGLTDDPEIASDGSSINLRAVDLEKNVQAGATNVALGTVTLTGESGGDTDVGVTVQNVDDDDGNTVAPETTTDTLTVSGTSDPAGPTVTLDLDNEGIDAGGTTTASLQLTEAPKGLSGFNVDVTVGDSGIVAISDASYSATFGLTDEADIAADGSSVKLRAVDLEKNVQAGATNVDLGTVTLSGESDGETDVGVTVNSMDDDEGGLVEPATTGRSLTVNGDVTDKPQISVNLDTDTVAAQETTTASIQLSDAPKGLSGFDVDVTVGDSAIASITDASYSEAFGLTDEVDIAGDGSSVNLKAADVDKNVEEGATNIDLGSVTLSGVTSGQTSVGVSVNAADADGGSIIPTTTAGDRLVVSGDSETSAVSVDLDSTVIGGDETTTASLSLSEVPNGLSGFEVDVTVDDSSVASFTGGSYSDAFGLTESVEIAADGSVATLRAADVDKNVQDGATDIALGTVTLSGKGGGETRVGVDVAAMDDDDGSMIQTTTIGNSLTVTGGQSEEPQVTVDLAPAEIEAGQSSEASVMLTEAPDGLSGYQVAVTVDDSPVATIEDASYPEAFGLTDTPSVSADSTSVTLKAADVGKNVQAGATDVELGTVTITGESSGETDVGVTVDSMDDDSGNLVSPATSGRLLTVTGEDGTVAPSVSVDLDAEEIAADGTTTASLQLSSAPKGLSGYTVDLTVDDSSVAAVTDASLPDTFGLSDDPQITANGSSVTLKAADVGKNVEAGATDIDLGTVTLSGQSGGRTDVGVTVDSMDDDDGGLISPTTSGTALTVNGDGTGEDEPAGPSTVSVTPASSEISAGGSTEATVTLSDAPSGLAGFKVDVSVGDASVVSITEGSYPDTFGLSDTSVSADGSTVTLSAVDVGGNVESGASDVDLGTVTLSGEGGGETDIGVTVRNMDDDSGSVISTTTSGGSVSVTGDSSPPEEDEEEEETDTGGGNKLIVNDYDGTPGWSGQNDLGNWNGSGSFNSTSVEDGALAINYDGAGWLVEKISQDVSDYSRLVFRIKGASGGEGSHFRVSTGGVQGTFKSLSGGSITTSYQDIAINLDDAGINKASPGELRLNFWLGSSGTIYIDEIYLE